jgi:ribosomal protein L7/L12
MSEVTGRVRPLLSAVPRRVIPGVALAAAGFAVALGTGRTAKARDIAAAAGVSLLIGAVGAVLRARKGQAGPASADLGTVPASEVSPAPDAEVLVLVTAGRKIQAIKRYRQLNPGIGLKQAKDVIDGL